MALPDGIEPILDKPQACEYLNISEWHLQRLIRYRQIPFVKVGRLIRFKPSDLAQWLDENRTEVVS
jgi:excisionase family DNA binding protein